MLAFLVPVLFAFYLQGVLKFNVKFRLQKVKCNYSEMKWKLLFHTGADMDI